MSDAVKPEYGKTVTLDTRTRLSMTVQLSRVELDQAVREYLSKRLLGAPSDKSGPFAAFFTSMPAMGQVVWNPSDEPIATVTIQEPAT